MPPSRRPRIIHGGKGVGESPTVGSPAAYVNAVVDAMAHLGVRNLEMPVTSDKVWAALRGAGVMVRNDRMGTVVSDEVLKEFTRLRAAGVTCCLATVMRVEAPDLGQARR